MKKYEELEIEVIRFDEEDIILTSGGDDVPPTTGVETPEIPLS